MKNGDMVYVSDISESHALKDKCERRFIGLHSNGEYVVEINNQPYMFRYAVPVPEKEHKPFTLKTLPKQAIVIRHKNSVEEYFVYSRGVNGISIEDESIPYQDMLECCEMSLDWGETWQIAGVEE